MSDGRQDSGAVSALLSPRSIVVVGASERSRWSSALLANLTDHGYRGPLHLVNPRGAPVDGRPTAPDCASLGEQVDLGVVVVPAPAVPDAVAGLADAGVGSAVVLTSGFAEVGDGGARLQDEVVRAASGAGVRMLGPNSLGFMNLAGGIVAWSARVRIPSGSDGVGLVSQSGATAYFLAELAHTQDVGLSHVVATGNEADLDGAAVVEYLVDDPGTRAIAVFVEAVRHPQRFAAAAEAARAAGKPMVVLKVGASEATSRAALAHTGALVGDDRVFDGVCARHGILRAHSLEELLTTADVLGRTGRLGPGGLGVVSNSGGVCEIAADAAARLGVDLPEVPARVTPRLRDALPGYATAHNPLDLTGGVSPQGCGEIVGALAASGAYAALLMAFYPADAAVEDPRLRSIYAHVAEAMRASPVPAFLVSYTPGTLGEREREFLDEVGMPYLACGLDRALTGLAGAFAWSRLELPATAVVPAPRAPIEERPVGELLLLDLMDAEGLPTVPRTLAVDEESAVAAARTLGGRVALKIAATGIGHKTEIGGIALGVEGDDEIAGAFRRVRAAGRGHGPVDGVLVAPMREGGVELLVGATTDPVWGPTLTVGVGGVWVEVLADVAVRPLPVTPDEARDMLLGLRGARMLTGHRGATPVDLGLLAATVAGIGDLALRLGPDLAALDVNPLWVHGGRVEALDALAVWHERTP